MWALPLEVPAEAIERFCITSSRAATWSHRYGLDFGGLVATSEENDQLAHVNGHDTRDWKRLSGPLLVADVDLGSARTQPIEREVMFVAQADGSLAGVLVFACADLGAGVRLSLHPDDATASNSWGNLLYLFAKAFDVSTNQEMCLRYRYDGHRSAVEVVRQPNRVV